MATTIEVSNKADLLKAYLQMNTGWGNPASIMRGLRCEPLDPGVVKIVAARDPRRWETHMIFIDKTPIGYSDGDIPD